MIIGERLRALRKQKNFTQGEVEKRSGLLSCYISRVEHGQTVPSIETLEKFARALEVPMYQLFYEGDKPLKLLSSLKLSPLKRKVESKLFGDSGKEAQVMAKFRSLLSRTDAKSQNILLLMAQKMARRKALQGAGG